MSFANPDKLYALKRRFLNTLKSDLITHKPSRVISSFFLTRQMTCGDSVSNGDL